jgi:single-strand DNA-binding protein
MSLNKVMLIGNLGHDPDIRYMPASKRAVTNLSIAMNDSFTDRSGNRQERTDWLTVVAYGKLAELCHQHLKRGRQVVCCESFIGDGGGPAGIGLQEQIPNHPKLRG